MGLISFQSGDAKGNLKRGETAYVGWVDTKTKEPVSDGEVANRYAEFIIEHCGIREIEPERFSGYDPKAKTYLRQVALEAHMPPFEVHSQAEVEHLRKAHGDSLDLKQEGDRYTVRLRKGAVIYVPKTFVFNRQIAGQVPQGFTGETYGIPADIISSIDPVTVFALAATMEAFASAGIKDPYELYKYVHVSEVGNAAGGGMGGMKSLRAIFRERFTEQPNLSSDLLQETFINTTPAWINMLLLSSSGPIKTPVAACATAAASVELAVDTLRSGKAKVMVAGGFEDFGEEGSYEFGQMKATSDSILEKKKGRVPKEMCRPATSTRAGFMESHGAGIQILATAELALEMGLPIYAIIGATHTATDRQGRSVPAPGQGILSCAREVHSMEYNPVLDLEFRSDELQEDLRRVEQWRQRTLRRLSAKPSSDSTVSVVWVEKEAKRRRKAAQRSWGTEFYKGHDDISPMRGALAVYGYTPDDLQVVSFHGTGTAANDKNESNVINMQMKHLGRSEGKPLYTIFQKWMTGHPKGAAAAWMLNGLIQSINSGIVPGNRAADNIDPLFEKFQHVVYSNTPVVSPSGSFKAAFLHSFGFGQAGAQIIIIHPDVIYDVVSEAEFMAYQEKRSERFALANRHWLEYMCGKTSLLPIKNHAPFEDGLEEKVYLNPRARAHESTRDSEYAIPSSSPDGPALSKALGVLARSTLETNAQDPAPPVIKQYAEQYTSEQAPVVSDLMMNTPGVGVDVEDISTFRNPNSVFLARNFTQSELKYCDSAPDRKASLAGRWCAKEAVIKALTTCNPQHTKLWQSGGSSLSEIEILSSASGAPVVRLHGAALRVAELLTGCPILETEGSSQSSLQGARITVSITHTVTQAAAIALVTQDVLTQPS